MNAILISFQYTVASYRGILATAGTWWVNRRVNLACDANNPVAAVHAMVSMRQRIAYRSLATREGWQNRNAL